jgi:DNA-binding NarL/FixJ family response regulator
VLLVDDHPSLRRGARALLAGRGFEIVGDAANGKAAFTLAAELEPELVLLDVRLLDLDGFEVATRLLERRPGLPIVLVSIHDRSDYGPLVDRSGASGFVGKEDLSAAVPAGLLR